MNKKKRKGYKRNKKKQIQKIAIGFLFLVLVGLWGTSLYIEHQTVNNFKTEEQENVLIDDERYHILNIKSCNLSGDRLPNTKVDVGYGDREYWAYTNEYGQLVRVVAEKIILQEDWETRDNGRYCDDEAKVKGTELKEYDEGHVIADSLGGVSNSYNITPQDSTVNRYGDQAMMEESIRQAGGCEHFEAILSYPNKQTQIPSHYRYSFTIHGDAVVFEFDNGKSKQ